MERLNGDIWLAPGRRGGRYPHCNSLLIDSGERAVIDPGSNRRTMQELSSRGVGTVLLSHFHSDHVRDLKEFSGSRTWVHEVEKDAVERWEGVVPLVWFPDEEERDPVWVRRKEREVGGWGWPVSGAFRDGDTFMIGGVEVEVIHTPGHTPGHCCFWFPAQGILYSADIDLTEFGPWYGNAGSDLAAFLRSIQAIKELDPGVTVTGHETGVINGPVQEKLDQYRGVIEQRHERILGFLKEPRAIENIIEHAFIYGPHFSASFRAPEMRMVRHHLSLALERGEAELREGLYRAL